MAQPPDGPPTEFEHVANSVEYFREATTDEPCSLDVWLQYCEYLSSLELHSQTWEEDERAVCQELFSDAAIEEVWQEGLRSTKYRLNDSHVLWDSWMSRKITVDSIDNIQAAFVERLQVPSAVWDVTSQQYSTFLSAHPNELSYEEAMIAITRLAKPAKARYSAREHWELKLMSVGDEKEALRAVFADYLDFETIQTKKERSGQELLCALHERALLAFPKDGSMWEDYVTMLGLADNEGSDDLPTAWSVIQRAVKHCPTAQSLWSRHLIMAEVLGMDESEIEAIMKSAVQPDNFQSMQEAVTIYSTWCGYLVRNADSIPATSAIEKVISNLQKSGEQDPTFSLERILIEYLTSQGDFITARAHWNKLSKTHGTSYDFWQQYYEWEMGVERQDACRPLATAVLVKAVGFRGLDWPEKIFEIYSRHCNLFLGAPALMASKDLVHKNQKSITKRRQREAAIYAEQQAQYVVPIIAPADTDVVMSEPMPEAAVETDTTPTKRKREVSAEPANKKARSEHSGDVVAAVTASPAASTAADETHRDRENLSLLVSDLPPDVTLTKIKQFFHHYGHYWEPIQLIKGDPATNKTSVALIEFRTPDDVSTALLRDSKPFHDTEYMVKVAPAEKLNLYVTNFPESENDNNDFIYEQFGKYGDIFPPRWPNKEKRLLANLKRRFVYVSFVTPEAAAAALELDDKEQTLKDNAYTTFKMTVKYSNPGVRKLREPKKKPPKAKTKYSDSKKEEEASATGSMTVEHTNEDASKGQKTKPPVPQFMVQSQIRRPVLGGAGKKKRGGLGGR